MKPNIVFIMADQMRGSAMGKGNEEVYTPNLDKLATEGTLFTRAVSNTPVCSPVRASIITGLHTLSHELVNNDKALRTDVKTLGHCLNEAGYKCGYIGKWHMDCADRGVFVPPGPRRQGFDDFWASYNCNHRYFEGYYYLNDNPEPIWIDGYEPFEQTRIAIEYLQNKSKEREPFCLFLSYGPPHCPYDEVPQKYKDMYPPEKIQPRLNASNNIDLNKVSGYYSHITALDECVGNLLNNIDKFELKDNTLVIFTSDHGDMLYSQDRGWKCKPWRESIIVPFIARWPGYIPSNRVSNGLFSHVDIMPTLLSVAGALLPNDMQGKDMSELLKGDESAGQDSVFINYPLSPKRFSFREWRGVVTKKYTYARFKDKRWVLYDDESDTYQLKNLIDNPDYENLAEELDETLKQWLIKLNDSFETSSEVAAKYYKGSVDGTIPFYENDIVKTEKAIRRQIRIVVE
ncbi:MAG: sulfatase [Clostridiales bacterium]|nr:sulfatase [Clostridiales bacterium]